MLDEKNLLYLLAHCNFNVFTGTFSDQAVIALSVVQLQSARSQAAIRQQEQLHHVIHPLASTLGAEAGSEGEGRQC